MYKILAVFSMTRYSPETLDRAIARARQVEDPRISVLYVTEKKDLDRLKDRALNQGFLGTFPVDRFMRSVLDEHERVREERLAGIRQRLDQEKIPFEISERRGNYSDCVIREVEGVLYDSVFLPKPSRSFLERVFFGSEIKRVAEYTKKARRSEVNIVE